MIEITSENSQAFLNRNLIVDTLQSESEDLVYNSPKSSEKG